MGSTCSAQLLHLQPKCAEVSEVAYRLRGPPMVKQCTNVCMYVCICLCLFVFILINNILTTLLKELLHDLFKAS